MKEDRYNKRRTGPTNNAIALLFVIILALSFSGPAHGAGGDILWQYGDTPQTGKQESSEVVIDSAGNTIITGYSDQSGSDDYYTIKITADGLGIMWSKTYDKAGLDDHARAVALDSNDNVLVTGYAWNGLHYDFHTIKYNSSDGAVLWEQTFNAAMNGNDYATSIAVDSLNNVYVGGNSQGTSGADDYMLIKYDPNGNFLWQKSYNGPANGHERITSITAGVDGIAVTGLSQNSAPDFDIYTMKYGFDGSLIWEKRKSASGDDKGVMTRMDSFGDVIMTGITFNGLSSDIYTVKYDGTAGTVLWEVTYNGTDGFDDAPADLFLDSVGNVYVAGDTFVLSGATDFYIAKYNGSTGSLLWDTVFNSFDGNQDRTVSLALDASGDLFVAGDTYDVNTNDYNFQTLKYTKNSGILLWQQSYNGAAGKDDRVAGIGISPTGEPIVAGWSDQWTSGASDYDYYAIKYDPGLINPPSNLTASAVSTSQIALSWTDNSSNEDNFRIERKIGDFGTYTEIATVGADITTYSDTTLTADTKYFYRVRSYNSIDGDSHYSNEAYAVTTIVVFTTPSLSYVYNGADDGDDSLTAIAAGPDNSPAVTGYSFSMSGQFDYYTLKLDRQDLGLIWSARHDSDQNDLDIAKTLTVDSNNDVFVSGYSYMYSIAAGMNTNDIYSIKYPSSGPPEDWNDQYNGPAGDDDRSSVVDVSRDGSNNYVVVGYGRNVNWDDDIYVVKYLNDGTLDWAATPYDGGIMSHDYPSAVSFDSSGDIIMAGYTFNGSDYDFLVRKYNGSTGAPVWTDVYNISGSGNDYTASIAVDLSGDIYVTGDAITSSGNEDFYTIKYDGATGARLWEKSFNGLANGMDEAISLKIDPVNSDIVVAGRTLTGVGNNDFHTIRYDSDGNTVWERTLDRPGNDDIATAMIMDKSGNVHIAGHTDSGADTDVISIQYDHSGSLLGGIIYNGSAGGNDGASAVTVNSIGEAFVGGFVTNTSGNTDYLVYKVTNNLLQAPIPFTLTPAYTQAVLTWTDNSTTEDGYNVERKIGACSSANPWSPVYTSAADEITYTDTILNISTEYCYRVQAFNFSGESSRWIETSTTTLMPAAPSGLSATAFDTTQIDLSWADNTNGEDGFRIERCEGAGCSNFAEIVVVGADVTAHSDTTVCHSTNYSYRVLAYKSGEWSTVYSNEDSAVSSTPGDPTALSATRVSEVQIDLSWTDNTTDETGFKIERCSGSSCSNFLEIDTVGADVTTYNDAGLTFDTTYNYRVKAYKTSSCGWETGYTNESEAITTIAAPTILTATSINTTQIDLTWTDNTASETGFKIERCEGAGCSSFAEIASLGPDVTVHSDDTVCDSISYSYRVLAYKTGEWSTVYSNEDTAVSSTPGDPATLSAARVSEVQIDLSWADNTTDETGFKIERCEGTGCSISIFAEIATVGADVTTYNDTGLTYSTTYNYRVKAYKTSSCGWETAFSNESEATTTIVDPSGLNAAASVGTNCNDIQFTDSTGSTLLNYWVESGCNTLSTNLWVNVPSIQNGSNTIYFYYDNPATSAASSGDNTFEFFDDFRGTIIDVSKWIEIDPESSIEQNNDLILNDVNGGWTKALISQQTFSRASDKMVYLKLRIPTDTPGTNNFMLGWEADQTTSPSYTQLVHGVYWNNYTNFDAYERGVNRGGTGTYTADTEYEMKIELKGTGARYYINGGAYSDWTLIQETTTNSDAAMRVAFTQLTHQANIHLINIRKYAASEPTLSAGVTEYGTYVLGPDTWNARIPITVSNAGADLTDYQVPVALGTTALAHNMIDLTWSDNTASETEFRVERCEGAGCSTFVQIDTAAADAASYSDSSVNISMTYCYRVMASNSGVWDSGYSNESCATTATPAAPSVLSATAIDENTVDLSWTDNTASESGFKVERCEGAGCSSFTEIAVLEPNTTAYSDISVCNTTSYTYRVKAFKTVKWETAYSNESSAVTLTPDIPGILTATGISEVQMELSWIDNSIGETGFRIERCEGAGCSSFVEIDTAGTDATSYIDTGLTPSTPYRYQIKAYSSAACGWETGYSNISEGTTLTPPAPTGLTGIAVNTTQLDLSWTDNTDSETGFRLQRCEGAGCVNFADLTTLGIDVTGYTDATVCSGITYRYQIRAEKTDGPVWNSPWSVPYETTMALPAAPGALTATRVSENQIDLSWTDNTSDETHFRIERCAGAGCSNFIWFDSVAVDITTYSDIALTHETSYTYRVRAHKTASCSWDSGYSNEDSAVTSITAPGGLAAAVVNTTQIDLSWSDNTVSETGFKIERCEGTGCSIFAEVATVGADITAYSDTSVCNTTEYSYQVRAYNGAIWNSGYSNTGSAITAALNGPDGFTATAVTDTEIDLSWNDNSVDESVFKIERCEGSGCGSFVQVDTVGSDITAYTDTVLTPATTYCYRVRANKSATCGWDTIYTSESCDLTFSAAATNLSAAAVNSMVIQLDWTDNATDEDGYEIEVQIFNGNFVNVATVGADTVTYTDSMAIQPEKQYTYRVRAFRGADNSPYSNEAVTMTPVWQASDHTCY